jgi:hypothetical protein
MIAPRESPTAIDKRYETHSAIDANRIIILKNNCLIVSMLCESYFIAAVMQLSLPIHKQKFDDYD